LTSANRIRASNRTRTLKILQLHLSFTFSLSLTSFLLLIFHRRYHDACSFFRKSYFRWSKKAFSFLKLTRWFRRLCDRIETYEEVQIASNMQDVNNLWSRQKVSRTCRKTSSTWFKQTYKMFFFHHCEARRWERRFVNLWNQKWRTQSCLKYVWRSFSFEKYNHD
jgi:hypothetical protein